MSDKIILNEKEMTSEEFEEEKKKIENQKGIQLIEVKSGEYKTRLLG